MFKRISSWAIEFLRDEDGPTAVEYCVMLSLIVTVCIVAIRTIGTNTDSNFAQVTSTLSASS